MERSRQAAVGVAALRIAYGAALALAPKPTTKNWLGPGREVAAAQVPIRALGAREIVLHAGAVAAALTEKAPVKPWLLASIGGDTADIVASFAHSGGLPDKAAVKTLAVAGGSALLSAAVLAKLDS